MKKKQKRRLMVGIVSLIFILSSLIPFAMGLTEQTPPDTNQDTDATSPTTEGTPAESGITAESGQTAESGITNTSGVVDNSSGIETTSATILNSGTKSLEPNFSDSNAVR